MVVVTCLIKAMPEKGKRATNLTILHIVVTEILIPSYCDYHVVFVTLHVHIDTVQVFVRDHSM